MIGKELHTSYSAMNKARSQIKECRLIFTTCIGAGLGLLRSESFDTVIIDEASQQTEAASLVPLVKGCQKAVLVGDHVQLGATVQQHAALMQFDVSLFERLYKQENGLRRGFEKIMLDTQYRMHKSICKFSSQEFYDAKLHTGILDSARPLPISLFPWPLALTATGRETSIKTQAQDQARMIFIECSASEDFKGKSKSNEGQSIICHETCKLLCTPPSSISSHTQTPPPPPIQQTIAVLTPYSAQVADLKTRLALLPAVEVSSIDGFQGREADIVVFVTVRCNAHCEIGFLKDLRRINVALTRAKAGVIVIGSRATLTMGVADPESTAVWKRLLGQLVEVKLGS